MTNQFNAQRSLIEMVTRGLRQAGNIERVALFIDMSNLYFAARQINLRVDYERLREFVGRDRSLLRAFAYMGVDMEDSQTIGLVNYLKRYAGYKVVTKPLRRFEDGSAKANLDIEMAIDMLTIAEHVDTIVLISGDGDFVRLVETVQFKGVRVEVIGLEGNTATALIEAADQFTNLADMVGDIQKVERPVYQRRFTGDNRPPPERIPDRGPERVPDRGPERVPEGRLAGERFGNDRWGAERFQRMPPPPMPPLPPSPEDDPPDPSEA